MRIFVSREQGTLFAGLLGHAAFVQDGEVVQGLLPVANRHGPSLRRLVNRHVHDLQRRLFVGVDLAVSREFADHAVDRFDRVGRVDRSADRRREVGL